MFEENVWKEGKGWSWVAVYNNGELSRLVINVDSMHEDDGFSKHWVTRNGAYWFYESLDFATSKKTLEAAMHIATDALDLVVPIEILPAPDDHTGH